MSCLVFCMLPASDNYHTGRKDSLEFEIRDCQNCAKLTPTKSLFKNVFTVWQLFTTCHLLLWLWSPLGLDTGNFLSKAMTHYYWVIEVVAVQKTTFIHETFYPWISTEENTTGMFVPCSLSSCSVVCNIAHNSAD